MATIIRALIPGTAATQPRKLILAAGIALALFSLSITARADDVVDARQQSRIITTYALNPYLRANDLQVRVDAGKATLSGSVLEGVSKELAEQIALGVEGIDSVDNQITIKADYIAPRRSAERSYGEMIDDATITTAVKSKLLWSRHVAGLSTEVSTQLGAVTLRGTADSEAAKALAGLLALNTSGVMSVDNQLRISPDAAPQVAAAPGSAPPVGDTISDSWITTKVKSTFMYSSNIKGSNISVSTKAGIVTLSGKVDSGAEQDLAILLAENVLGVKSVEAGGLEL